MCVCVRYGDFSFGFEVLLRLAGKSVKSEGLMDGEDTK